MKEVSLRIMSDKSNLPPGHNCGKCGPGKSRNCENFAANIKDDDEIKEYLSTHSVVEEKAEDVSPCLGCTDGHAGIMDYGNDDGKADLRLGPIPGEPSCREDLYPFVRSMELASGDVLKYRPLGCPIVHFARVMRYAKGIATVHLAGPHRLLGKDDIQYKDAGVCMVTGFEGSVVLGRIPDVGETVRFVPSHCRMQQVHSGVIVHSEGKKIRIEGIDLKVWR